MATQRPSTIYSEVDFKLRLIAHFRKVHDKCPQFPSTQLLMKDQTVRTHSEIREMIYAPEGLGLDRRARKFANRMVDRYDIKNWIAFCLGLPGSKPTVPPEIQP